MWAHLSSFRDHNSEVRASRCVEPLKRFHVGSGRSASAINSDRIWNVAPADHESTVGNPWTSLPSYISALATRDDPQQASGSGLESLS
jgi:hypothetical protein